MMPSKLEHVFDQPKIFEMIAAIGKPQVLLMLKFELIKLAGLMSVENNLTAVQISFIADQLLELYPSESIADFKLAFQNAAIGAYGPIYRLDGITIGLWMKSYLNAKYEVLEQQHKMQKNTPIPAVATAAENAATKDDEDRHQQWLNKLKEATKSINKIPAITDEIINQQGKVKPPKKHSYTAGYSYYNIRGVQIFASSQEHAEKLCEKLLKDGYLEEDI